MLLVNISSTVYGRFRKAVKREACIILKASGYANLNISMHESKTLKNFPDFLIFRALTLITDKENSFSSSEPKFRKSEETQIEITL